MNAIDPSNERSVRLEKVSQLQEAGIDPYPPNAKRSHEVSEVKASFDVLSSKETAVSITGRLRLLRRQGGSTFAQIEDESGSIQLFFNKKLIGEEEYKLLKLIDVADFLSVEGVPFLTKTEEQTIKVSSFTLLTKAIRPLPDKFHGLKDEEYRYRHRYVDLIVNKDVKELFRKRSLFVQSLREFMHSKNFLEVETPVLENIPGGAEAEPFITHHNTLDIDLYLRISLELHLKRLMVGGYERIFEIGKVFRNEGMSTQHLQEFTMIEFYWAYANNDQLMDLVEEMYKTIIEKTFGTLQITYKEHTLDFAANWPRLDYRTLFQEKSGIDLTKVKTADALKKEIKDKGIKIKIDPTAGYGRLVDQVYKKLVRPSLIQPCFLTNHPVEISPLSKRDPQDPTIVQRHQVLLVGSELGNGFSELNDPIDQKSRFEDQMKLREAGDMEAQMIDMEYVQALEHGMPPTAGFGVGIDRLFSILTNQDSIRDVVFFPTMKPEHKEDEE